MAQRPGTAVIRADVERRAANICPVGKLALRRSFDKEGLEILGPNRELLGFVSYDWYRGDGEMGRVDAVLRAVCDQVE